MPEPNPLLGLHVAPGAVAWAQVLRSPDQSFRVLAWAIERASDDATVAVARAAEVASRRPFRGRGAFVALPDGSGTLSTACMQPEELDLAGDDLKRELHEYTPFEPDVASLRFRLAKTEGRKRMFVVAAIPAAQERRFLDAAAANDDGTIGYGFAGASLVRGARALGLIGEDGFLVEVLPRTTHVYALNDARVRRYVIAAGADDVVAAAAKALGREAADVRHQVDAGSVDDAVQTALTAGADAISEDVRGVAAYHLAQQYAPKDVPEGLPGPRFVGVGPLLGRAPIRRALAAHLGESFAHPVADTPSTVVTWDRPPAEDLPAIVGAVGAALEAFEPIESRLALRHPPREVEEFREGRRWVPAAAALVLALGAAAAWVATRPPEGPATAPRSSTVTVPGTTEPPVRGPAALAPTFRVESAPDGGVRIAWSGGARAGRWKLLRLDPGAASWADVTEIGASESGADAMDYPPGPTGLYRWRLLGATAGVPDGDEMTLQREVRVEREFLGLDGAGRARFRLRRPWRGSDLVAEVASGPGEAVVARCDVPGTAGQVVLDPGLTVRGVRVREEETTVRVPLPDFDPSGRVRRAQDGSPVLVEREVRRKVPVHDVDVTGTADGRQETVSRKMTDG